MTTKAEDDVEMALGSVNTGGLTPGQLGHLIYPKNFEFLQELGGIEGVANKLHVDLSIGLRSEEQKVRLQNEFGQNVLPKPHLPSFHFVRDAIKDKTLILLTIAASVSLALGIWQDIKRGTMHGWIEGIAIMFAVVIVVLVNSINDYQKDLQFRKLSAKSEERNVTLLRNGIKQPVSIFDITVGDVVVLAPGDVIPADGLLIDGYNVECDESGATGESDAVKKRVNEEDVFMISGTKVLDGNGTMLVIAVGQHSFNGRILMAMREDSGSTPLQQKLDSLAENIAKVGAAVAIIMCMALLTKFCVQLGRGEVPRGSDIFQRIVMIAIQTITVVVVAVPEGLPMAVTLALAFATTRMMSDNNLVRVLAACETMGCATSICSDKTGTLTENNMTVVKARIGYPAVDYDREKGKDDSLNKFVSPTVVNLLADSISINSTAYMAYDQKSGQRSWIGSKTESALLNFVSVVLQTDWEAARRSAKILSLLPFSSERKQMTTIVDGPNGKVIVYVKGAAEIVIDRCDYIMKSDGSVVEIDEGIRNELAEYLGLLADEALRTISVAFSEIPREDMDKANEIRLILVLIVGIEDPLRPGVVEAVEACHKAGLFVRVVTGDSLRTAQAIAKKCGILQRGGLVMEGVRFRAMNDSVMEESIPRLQVLARSSPLDKQILVRKLRQMGDVVAVTGDGTNDGPALRAANVGFAMGIAGTEVAKTAASIVLLDDNFASIVKAVAWGRCVRMAVRKFLQFQLTVNVAAVITAFATAILSKEEKSVLTAVQMLWVNLIMDTLAALALATDRPTPDLLDKYPDPPSAPLISSAMKRQIVGQSSFQVAVIFCMMYLIGPALLRKQSDSYMLKATTVFNTFVFLQLFNQINCRSISRTDLNVFKGISRNWIFLVVWSGCAIIQFLIVNIGGLLFSTVPLTWDLWLVSVAIGITSLPIGLVLRLIPEFGEPEASRVFLSKERLQWQAAISEVRKGLAVFTALRRARRPLSVPPNVSVNSGSELESLDPNFAAAGLS